MKSKTGPDDIGSKNSMHKCVNAHIGQTQSLQFRIVLQSSR